MGLASSRLPRVRPGDRLAARYINEFIRLHDREIRGICVLSDPMGTLIWQAGRTKFKLTRLMLAEDHPGFGEVFMCYKGVWDAGDTCWVFDCEEDCDDWVYAIDWFYGGDSFTYPEAGATGLFVPRPSTSFGTIWECVSLDCESQGACEDLEFCAGTYTGTCGTGTGTGTGT